MKTLLAISLLFASVVCFSQDSVKVKIKKVKGHSVWMKTLERPRVKLFSFCKSPYKKKDIVWIRKPDNF